MRQKKIHLMSKRPFWRCLGFLPVGFNFRSSFSWGIPERKGKSPRGGKRESISRKATRCSGKVFPLFPPLTDPLFLLWESSYYCMICRDGREGDLKIFPPRSHGPSHNPPSSPSSSPLSSFPPLPSVWVRVCRLVQLYSYFYSLLIFSPDL